MQGFVGNIEQLTLENSFFRKVLYTGKHAQLVLMCLQVDEEIGMEVHEHVDQFFRIESGEGVVLIDGEKSSVSDGDAFIVPAGSEHNVINVGGNELKLYTVYSPPNHPPGTIHQTKQDALDAEAHEA